jgi:hypothetical protein
MISVCLGAMGVWWYGITKADPAYNNVWDTFIKARTNRFSKKMGFDAEKYKTLQTEIGQIQGDLSLWRDNSGVSRKI